MLKEPTVVRVQFILVERLRRLLREMNTRLSVICLRLCSKAV